MRLFQVLFRRKNMPNGHIYRGKQRLVKEVIHWDRQQLVNNLQIEEQNMFYLRHPYLTEEQSAGHARALGKNEQRTLEVHTKVKEFRPNVTVEQRLAHLRFNEPWE